MLIFYDFECFKYDWLVVLINPIEKEKTVIINNRDELVSYYEKHKEDIWIGYNSRGYDQWILKGILCGFNPYNITSWIIEKGNNGYMYSEEFKKIKLYNYDVFTGYNGLKTLEGFMGNSIKETSVPFNLDRKLTPDEISETVKYCVHDVEQTIEVFIKRKDDFATQLNIIKEFKLPLSCINKSSAQLLATILGGHRREYSDEFKIRLPETLKLDKYKYVGEWFLNSYEKSIAEMDRDYEEAKEALKASLSKKEQEHYREIINAYESDYQKTFASYFYSQQLNTMVSGVEHNFAWGGVHSAIPQFKYECKDDELMLMVDVSSMYPSITVKYHLYSRSAIYPERYNAIVEQNLIMKKNKDPKRPIYKLLCNIGYGCSGDKYNPLYDPLHRNLVCVFGEVFLLDLIEKLESHCKLIQSNTDGILILIKKKDFELVKSIVSEWEQRTLLNMEFTEVKKIFQKDVNNYVMITSEGKVKSKGAYVKKLTDLDYDLPIINKAMVDYMVNNIPIETTINQCNTLKDFQKIVKISSNYHCGWHNNQFLTDKTFRVFASRSSTDTYIGKVKEIGATIEKFANTPDHCLIINDDINEMEIPHMLDRQWYVDLTRERLIQFGVM